MKISIALCTYNGAHYLQEQLESIAIQTRLPDELIICDDKSIDKTADIVKTFSSKVSFPINFSINEMNIGSTKNFEKAIDLCTGEIIVLSDQDDVWYPEKLEYIEKVFLSSSNSGVVFTDAEVVNENLQSLGYSLWKSIGFDLKEQKLVKAGKPLEVLLRHNVATGATMAFRSTLKSFFLPVPAIWVHDAWIALLSAFMLNLEIIPKPLIKYRQHSMQQLGPGYYHNLYSKIKGTVNKIIQIKKSSELYLNEYNRCKLAYERLNDPQFPLEDKRSVHLLKKKISHLNTRTNLPKGKTQRLHIFVKELVKLNYHHYSNGFYSFGLDVLFRL